MPHFSHEDAILGPNGQDHDDFELPEELIPFLDEKPLENDITTDTIALWWAPEPYSLCSGHMRRVQDIPLVKNWYLEHCPPNQPVKVQVSYQKLLKCYVLNKLKSRPEKANDQKEPFPAVEGYENFTDNDAGLGRGSVADLLAGIQYVEPPHSPKGLCSPHGLLEVR